MTPSELDSFVWDSLPPMRFLAGRRVVARLTRSAARRMPGEVLGQCETDVGRDEVLEQLVRSVERNDRANYQIGFVLSFILSALISEIVRALWKWWWNSEENRTSLAGWQQEGNL